MNDGLRCMQSCLTSVALSWLITYLERAIARDVTAAMMAHQVFGSGLRMGLGVSIYVRDWDI